MAKEGSSLGCTFGHWQGLDLLALALVFGPWSILASLLALGHLSLLALVTSLARPFGDFKRRKRGLVVKGCSGGEGKSNERREHH